jgi:hypothetical protein
MSQCFGIKIILQDKDSPVVEDTTIGLYNVTNDNSEFKWIQNDISGLSLWKSGMIIENGIEPFSIEIDLTTGGNTSYPGKGSVSIKNNLQFHQTILNLNIKLAGLKIEIWHFSGATGKRYRTYICEEPTFDSKKFTIPFKGGQENRIANILNMVTTAQFPYASSNTVGKPLPATFGKLIPSFNSNTEQMERASIAKFLRTNDRVDLNYYSDDFFTESGYTKTISFPITAVQFEPLTYQCELRTGGTTGSITPFNLFVKVVDGIGKGQIRKINSLHWTALPSIEFVIQDYFENELLAADTEGGRSWVQFIRVYRRYDVDHWMCKGFYDSENNALVNGAEIYNYTEDDGLLRMAPYGYEFKGVSESKNQIEIDPKLFDAGNLDQQNSFLILPVENPIFANDTNLDNWSFDEVWWHYTKDSLNDGFYSGDVYSYGEQKYSIESIGFLYPFYCIDKEIEFYTNIYLELLAGGFSYPCYFYKVITFDIPQIPHGFTFSNCYIGIKLRHDSHLYGEESGNLHTTSHIKIKLRKFAYSGITLDGDDVEHNNFLGYTYDNIPDFYVTDQDSNNKSFFVNESNVITGKFTGFNNLIFDTGITSKEELETYIQGGIFISGSSNTEDTITIDDSKLYELCFIFKKSSDIGKSIYIPFHGRNIASTWQGRKTESTLIEHPVDLLEHICRLQDYRDTCPIPVSGWGLQYANEPLIETGLEFGTFDNAELGNARMYALAGQIFDYDQGYTDKLKQNICSEFALANWQSADGKERVIFLPENKLSPVYTITLDDITDRSKIKVQKISSNKIYAEPFVNYNKNPATEKYDNAIYIKNTSASIYNPDYVIGIQSSLEKEMLWNSCHSLALQCHSLNKPPSNMTDLIFANGDGSYTIAYNHLKNWVNWQFCEEINFETHFNIAGSWQECTPINILFSHQTNNISRSALVEESIVNPNHPYDVMIRAIMYA